MCKSSEPHFPAPPNPPVFTLVRWGFVLSRPPLLGESFDGSSQLEPLCYHGFRAVVCGRRSHGPNSHEGFDNSTVTTVRHHVSDSPSRIRKPDAPPGCDVTVTSQECAECHDTHQTNRAGERFVCGLCGHLAHVGIAPRGQCPTPCAVRLLVRFVLRVQVNQTPSVHILLVPAFSICKLRPTVR